MLCLAADDAPVSATILSGALDERPPPLLHTRHPAFLRRYRTRLAREEGPRASLTRLWPLTAPDAGRGRCRPKAKPKPKPGLSGRVGELSPSDAPQCFGTHPVAKRSRSKALEPAPLPSGRAPLPRGQASKLWNPPRCQADAPRCQGAGPQSFGPRPVVKRSRPKALEPAPLPSGRAPLPVSVKEVVA